MPTLWLVEVTRHVTDTVDSGSVTKSDKQYTLSPHTDVRSLISNKLCAMVQEFCAIISYCKLFGFHQPFSCYGSSKIWMKTLQMNKIV